MIRIDGSRGEGGGQILRTSLALAMVTQQPFVIHGIRKGRKKPGLMRQHLTCVQAAQVVCGARVEGDTLGSTQLTFAPGAIQPGDYSFAVGTAGSTTLVLQTLAPALMSHHATVTVEGGTHNPMAPSADFLQSAFVEAVNSIGFSLAVTCERPGFYPAGGGRIQASFAPGTPVHTSFCEGTPAFSRAWAAVADLSQGVAHRELQHLADAFGWARNAMEIRHWQAQSAGNVVVAEFNAGGVTEHFFALGERGKSAESVAADLVGEVKAYLAVGAPVGPHLADQLILPLLLGDGGRFRTGPPTQHTLSQIETVSAFSQRHISCECLDADRRIYEITVEGA